MKKKVLALTLSAALALSATPAFAAETNCTKVANKYDFNSLLQKYASQCENLKNKKKKLPKKKKKKKEEIIYIKLP